MNCFLNYLENKPAQADTTYEQKITKSKGLF